MKVLVVGSGGREHAIIKKLKCNESITQIFAAPGNAGISEDAVCIEVLATDVEGMVTFAKQEQINLVVVAPDDPLVLGMVDALEAEGIRAYGPSKAAAIIEGSKIFAKNLMQKYHIPTAQYATFDEVDKAKQYIEEYETFPVVIKADGLALGKGVIIAMTKEEALQAIQEMMVDGAFGKSGQQVVIEEFLEGVEVSILTFTDGHTIKAMVSSMDHKRALDGDLGLNTGGMGVVAPNPYYTAEIDTYCMEHIFKPTVEAMKKENRLFKGTLYFGLIITNKGPYVIEYNCRFGDPETQVCLPLLESDLLDIFMSVIDERLDKQEVILKKASAACVIGASGGYPTNYQKGKTITGLEHTAQLEDIATYHAGTKVENSEVVTNGGRVIGITGIARTLEEALEKAYKGIACIHFEGIHYRKDIGAKALERLDGGNNNGCI